MNAKVVVSTVFHVSHCHPITGEPPMVTITRRSKDPCLICGKVEHNVEVKGTKPRILGPMCLKHAYERLAGDKQAEENGTTSTE
jgi:hypothetical protein